MSREDLARRQSRDMDREDFSARREEREADRGAGHPALKGYSRVGAQARHVLSQTAKYGAIGAAAGASVIGLASVAGLLTAGGGCAAAAVPTFGLSVPICGGLAYLTSGAITSTVTGMATAAAMTVGGGAAALGAVMGASGMADAADAEEDKIVRRFEQAQARTERLERLRDARDRQMAAMERQEMQMRGVNPNRNLPGRQEAGMEGPAYG